MSKKLEEVLIELIISLPHALGAEVQRDLLRKLKQKNKKK